MLSVSSTSVAAAGPSQHCHGDASEMVALSGLSAAQHRRAQAEAAQERQNQKRKRCRPSCGCLAATVFVTLLGTAALASSIFTDHWERIDYDANRIEMIANQFNGSHRLTWLFNRTVARIVLTNAPAPLPVTTTTLMERSAPMGKSGGSYRSSSYWSSSARRNGDLATAAAAGSSSGGRFVVAGQQQQQQQDPLTTTETTATTREIDGTTEETKSSVVPMRTRDDDRRRHYSEQQLLQVVVNNNNNNNNNSDEDGGEGEGRTTTITNKVKRSLTHELAINKSPSPPHRRTRINAHAHHHLQQQQQQQQLDQLGMRKKRSRMTATAKTTSHQGLIYLIPLHGGIFSLCIDLEKNQLQMLQDMGLNRNACTGYLALAEAHNSQHNPSNIAAINADLSRLKAPNGLHHYVQSKMHNLSISCAVVCVILLGAAAILGLFGILRRELSAVLVTGVMYILAALFAIFSLVIMHCKRNARRETGIIDDLLVNSTDYNESRVFSNSWSMILGWLGSGLIFFASLFWLFLAKVMRYTPLTFF